MVRNYMAKREAKYTNEQLQQAVAAVASNGVSMSQAARKFDIPTSTQHNNVIEKHKGWGGRKTMQEER